MKHYETFNTIVMEQDKHFKVNLHHGDSMKKRHVIAIVLVLLFITIPLSAQNYLFQNGQSGFHLKGSFSKIGLPFDEYNTEIGYTIKSRLSLKLNYSQWDPNFNGDEIHFIGGGLDYLLIEQAKFPISVSFGSSYMYSRNITDRYYEITEMEQDTVCIHDIDLVTGFHRRFELNNNLVIIPSFTLCVTKRVFYSTSGDIYVQDPVPLIYVGSINADLIFRFLNVFTGIDYDMTQRSFHYHLGIGILLKHRTASKK